MATATVQEESSVRLCSFCVTAIHQQGTEGKCGHILCKECTNACSLIHPNSIQFRCPTCGVESYFSDPTQPSINAIDHKAYHSVEIVKREATPEPPVTCVIHTQRETNLFCNVCLSSICSHCSSTYHKGHEILLISDKTVRKKARKELRTLQRDITKHIEDLEKFADCLSEQRGEINKRNDLIFSQINLRVEEINSEVKRLGEKIKVNVLEHSCRGHLVNNEVVNIVETAQNIEKLTSKFKASTMYSDSVLNRAPFVEVLRRLPQVRAERAEIPQQTFHMPLVPKMSFEFLPLNKTNIHNLVGDLKLDYSKSFICSFDADEVSTGQKFSPEYTYYGSKFRMSAYKMEGRTDLMISFEETTGIDRHVGFNVRFKLINQMNEDRSINKAYVETMRTLFYGHHLPFMSWDRLYERGFTENNTFKIEVSLQVAPLTQRK